jgi:hypothetical protein
VWRARIVLLSADGVGTITIQAAAWQEQADDLALAGSARWPKEVDGLLHRETHPAVSRRYRRLWPTAAKLMLRKPPGETVQ